MDAKYIPHAGCKSLPGFILQRIKEDNADVVQLVERQFSKLVVASSSLVIRSIIIAERANGKPSGS